jgi:putative transposase
MNEVSLLQSLGQVSASQSGEVFRDLLRGQMREMICEVIAAEVTELFGPMHSPSGSDHYRTAVARVASSTKVSDRKLFGLAFA